MLNHFTFSIQIQRPKPPNWGLENNIWSCCCSFPGPGSKPATKYRLMHSAEKKRLILLPIGSTYAIYGNIYHQYTPNVSIYTIHGSYGYRFLKQLRKPIGIRLIILHTSPYPMDFQEVLDTDHVASYSFPSW